MRHFDGRTSKHAAHRSHARVVGAVAALILFGPAAPAQTTQPFDPTPLYLAWTAPLRNTLHSLPVVDGAAGLHDAGVPRPHDRACLP